MRLVVIESPYAGDVQRNLIYARRAMAHSLSLDEAPIASHLLYTQPGILDDLKPEERELGMAAGALWGDHAAVTVFYVDYGWSEGMLSAEILWQSRAKTIFVREIGKNPTCKHVWTNPQVCGICGRTKGKSA